MHLKIINLIKGVGIALLLLVVACKPTKGKVSPGSQENPQTKEQILRASLEVMKNEVNEYVEENQDVKMEFDHRKCTCRYFVGNDFATAELRWTIQLRDMDKERLIVVSEDGMMRVEMHTAGDLDRVYYEERNLDPLNINELNVYLDPKTADSGNRYADAMRVAIQACDKSGTGK